MRRSPDRGRGRRDRRAGAAPRLPSIGADGRWRLLAVLVGNGLAQAVAAVVAALVVERAFGQLGATGPVGPGEVARTGASLAVAGAAVAWLRGRERVDAERLGQDYAHRLRLRLFDHVTGSAPRAMQQRSRGSTVLRFVGDLDGIRRWISHGLARLLVSGTMTVGALGALAVLSAPLACAATLVVLGGGIATVAQGRELQAVTREARRRRSRLAANVNEKVAAVGVVQAFGAVDRERRRVRRQSRRLQSAMVRRADRVGRVLALSEATASAATAAVLVTGLLVDAPIGTVAAAMTVTGLLVPQLRDLGRVQERWSLWRVARDAVLRFLARPTLLTDPAPGDATPLRRGPGELTFVDASVDGALHGLSATVAAGQRVALVGPNGAGKTTLLALAARLLDPDRGRVLLDGQDLAGHRARDARALLGICSPDLPLLRGSVGHNLRYRAPDAGDDEVARVAALTGVDELIDELPRGAATRVAEDGGGLSAGQRQRVMLARAVLGDPVVLLLDEVDANLDPAAIAVVDRVLDAHRGTVIIVTHELERLRSVDVVWHLDDGRLVEVGRPAALLRRDGPTARLFATSGAASGPEVTVGASRRAARPPPADGSAAARRPTRPDAQVVRPS